MDTSRPPRVLVDVEGRAVCARLRRPPSSAACAAPVVLVAGGAGQGTDGEWGPVVEDRLVEGRPVLTYDRSGAGRSDGPVHGTVAGMAEELDQVLRGIGLPGPVVLVGWSLGGHVVQGYALRHPENVAGLVFVDPTPVEPPPRTAAVRVQLALTPSLTALIALAARMGVFSGGLGPRLATAMAGAGATPETVDLVLRLLRSPTAMRAQAALMGLVPRYSAELVEALARSTFPDVPTTVITAAKRDRVPAEYVANIRESHETLARRFPRGRLVTAERAGHQVPFDDPDVVVEAVRSVAG